MSKIYKDSFFICLLAITLIDIFVKQNGFVELFLAIVCSFIIYYLNRVHLFISKRIYFVLLFINIAVLAVTYTYKIYLLNILFLSYLIWNVITPKLIRFKALYEISVLVAFAGTYLASVSKYKLPIFILVFYPIYIFGVMNRDNIFAPTLKALKFILTNLMLSGALLVVFLYKTLGMSIAGSVLFTNIEKQGAVTAVYLPFIAVLLIWLATYLNILISMLFQRVSNTRHISSIDVTIFRKHALNYLLTLLLMFLLVLLLVFSVRQQLLPTINILFSPNFMFSILLLSGFYLLLLSILGRGISNILIITLTVITFLAEFIKIRYFGEPFYPWNFYLVKELWLIIKDYINVINVTVLAIVIILIIFALFKNARRIRRSLKPQLKIVLLPFALTLILTGTIILSSKDLSAQINIHKNSSLETEYILSNGVIVQNCFYLSNLSEYLDREPDKYSYSKMKQLDIKYRVSDISSSKTSIQPNIVMIMSESFWDVTQLKGITFNKDLTPNLRKYQKGELASPAIGGGTANVEFEALTGMSMFFLNQGAIPYNIYINSDVPSIASVLKNNGYNTIAMHPNVPTMYNRNNVYTRLGFDTFMDVSYFNYKEQAKGRHVSDDALIDKILGELDKSVGPKFIFAVTMQNHDPYVDKYKKEDLEIKADGEKLTDKDKNILSNYAQGIYDADKSIGKLIDSLSKSSNPTLVYYFGDHAPRIGSMQKYYDLYNELGSSHEYGESLENLKYFMTPLATWSNYAEMRTFDKIISPAHLSYEVLKDAEADFPNYFNILPKLEEKYPVLHLQIPDSIDKNSQLIKDYEMIQYDLLFGHKYYKK